MSLLHENITILFGVTPNMSLLHNENQNWGFFSLFNKVIIQKFNQFSLKIPIHWAPQLILNRPLASVCLQAIIKIRVYDWNAMSFSEVHQSLFGFRV